MADDPGASFAPEHSEPVNGGAPTILQRIASGDSSAVAACLDEYGGTVMALAQRYLRPLGGDVDDAVQEIFVEVWKGAARFDPSVGGEPAFIATIAHRRLIDRQRRNATRRTIQTDDQSVLESRPAMVEVGLLGEDARRAAEAFGALDSNERQVLWFAIYHGLSHERIAQAINVPLGTVKTRIRRGLMRLRGMLQAEPAAAGKGGGR